MYSGNAPLLVILSIGMIILSFSSASAQPGMYNESDIEYQTLFIEAQSAKYKGDTDAQIETLNEIIKRNKSSHAAYYELAKTYHTLGNYELAQKNIQKADNHSPNNEYYLLTMAEILEKSGQQSLAIGAYENLRAINPGNPTIYHKLAQLQLHDSKPMDAVKNLELLQQRQGINEETSRRIFDIYKTIGKKKEAVATLENLISDFPDNTRYRNNLASYYMEIGDEKSANNTYKNILSIDPNDPTASVAIMRSEKKMDKGGDGTSSLLPMIENVNLPLDEKIKELMPMLTSINKGDDSASQLITLSDRLVDLYPKEAKVYSLKGDVYFYLGKYEQSEASYKKAINIDDRKYTLWSQYMQNLWELEKINELNTISEEAIDLYPNQVSAFLFHAVSMKDKTSAKDLCKEASYIAGKNASLQNGINLVTLWLDKSNADEKSVKALDIKSLTDPLHFELAGDLYAQISDNAIADKLYSKAIDLGANESRVNKKIGSK